MIKIIIIKNYYYIIIINYNYYITISTFGGLLMLLGTNKKLPTFDIIFIYLEVFIIVYL